MIDEFFIEKQIGYHFNDITLLQRAFTHSSYANENKHAVDYERLEFLGDAILGYVVGDYLYRFFPTQPEGFLTDRRAFLVNADTLSSIIDELDLVHFMRIGSNAADNVLSSKNVKCDLFEAIAGAIYLDSGVIDDVKAFIIRNIEKYILIYKIDYKSRTLEYLAKNRLSHHLDTEKKGDLFTSILYVNEKRVSEGEGTSKKEAEKNACKVYYQSIIEK